MQCLPNVQRSPHVHVQAGQHGNRMLLDLSGEAQVFLWR